MGRYDTQQVCLKGHQITDSYNRNALDRKDFCPECGEKTIFACPSCNTQIKGEYYSDDSDNNFVLYPGETLVPKNCDSCGEPFPWSVKINPPNTQKMVIENNACTEIMKICSRFHLIAKQLRQRHDQRTSFDINDEYDVQDLMHSLLHLYFNDIRPEEWTPSYAGKSARVDFLIKGENIIIEVKKTRPSLDGRKIGDELIIDSQRYRAHPDCKKLICFVYDPDNNINNPVGLENDLNKKEEDFEIKVIINPKGL